MTKIISGFHRIHRLDGLWQYRIGRSGGIVLFSPNNTRIKTDQSEVTGISWDEIERASWKGYATGIKPSNIEHYIDKLPGNI